VRLRVNAGPACWSRRRRTFVLAPVTAPLRLGGRTIAASSLDQDDEGYLRLTRRLVGLRFADVHEHEHRAPAARQEQPWTVAWDGARQRLLRVSRRSFRVFTVDARAFPSGPLTIRVLVPIPYA